MKDNTFSEEQESTLTIESLQEALDLVKAVKPKLIFTSVPLPAPPSHFTSYTIPPRYKQIRFPRSKKKRIRKKWSKRAENYGYCDVIVITDPLTFNYKPLASTTL